MSRPSLRIRFLLSRSLPFIINRQLLRCSRRGKRGLRGVFMSAHAPAPSVHAAL